MSYIKTVQSRLALNGGDVPYTQGLATESVGIFLFVFLRENS